MKFSEVIAKVTDLATVIRDYWAVELPKRHPNYPLVDPDTDDPPPPPQEDELRQFLLSRPPEEVYKLRALADVGSGVSVADFDKQCRLFTKYYPDPRSAIEQLLRYSPLADGLLDGLAEFAARNINVDAEQAVTV